MKYLIFDVSNLLYRTYYANKDEDADTISGLAQHQALVTLNKYYEAHKPDKIVMAFDSKSWRKEYTLSDECVSDKIYKANRRKDVTKAEAEKYESFLNNLNTFSDLIKEYSTIIYLEADKLEADDLIAGFIQKYENDNNEMVIISADGDFIQLLKYKNTTLITPIKDEVRSLTEWDNNAELFMFEKCIRGDAADNVQSAFPKVRKTKIRGAWVNELDKINMMESKWTNNVGKEFRVKDVFDENKLLMDLSCQPDDIKEIIFETIEDEMNREKKYDFFGFLMFLGKNNLQVISENAQKYAKMMSL